MSKEPHQVANAVAAARGRLQSLGLPVHEADERSAAGTFLGWCIDGERGRAAPVPRRVWRI
eukprot:1947612-Lingulodinium_polyedra.AAC.1